MSNTADSDTTTAPLAPTTLSGGPEDVLSSPRLTTDEKREIFARWASDAHAVENAPALRQLDNGAIVNVDDVLDALRALDAGDESVRAGSPGGRVFGRRRGGLLSRLRVTRRRREFDDDPPPRPPASAAYAVRIDALAA